MNSAKHHYDLAGTGTNTGVFQKDVSQFMVRPLTRYTYCAFIATVPFEAVDIGELGQIGALPKIVGYICIGAALLQPNICFRRPPAAFAWFTAYLGVYCILGATQESKYTNLMLAQLFTLTQLLILFWLSLNLFRYEQICKQALFVFAGSCLVVAVLQLSAVLALGGSYQRTTAFGENANEFGGNLSLALLALVGLAYGRRIPDRNIPILAWIGCGIAAAGIVITGSRGAMVSVVLGFAIMITGKTPEARSKLVSLAVLGVVFLICGVYTQDELLHRWERALVEGNLSGREQILPEAWKMFLEKPFLGWGPILNLIELGSRFGREGYDMHNLYLWIMTEGGAVGAIPFFTGLWMALYAAWSARLGREGNVPTAMIICLLILNMSGTWHLRKVFWIILGYALASASSSLLQRRHVVLPVPGFKSREVPPLLKA